MAVVGVFRHGAVEDVRMVTIDFLHEDAIYQVYQAAENQILKEATGKSLKEQGFEVKLVKEYDGVLMEVRKVK